jgi:hypothetical protein
MNAFCASVNFYAFIVSTPPSQGDYSGKLQFKMLQFPGNRAMYVIRTGSSEKQFEIRAVIALLKERGSLGELTGVNPSCSVGYFIG